MFLELGILERLQDGMSVELRPLFNVLNQGRQFNEPAVEIHVAKCITVYLSGPFGEYCISDSKIRAIISSPDFSMYGAGRACPMMGFGRVKGPVLVNLIKLMDRRVNQRNLDSNFARSELLSV